MASHNGEDIDIQVPNAFLSGLNESLQYEAKLAFKEAVFNAARIAQKDQSRYGGLQAIYLHWRDSLEIPEDLMGFVVRNTYDAFAPDNVSYKNLNRRVAVCTMGDATAPYGNGALGPFANHAMEENTARRAGMTFEAMGPAFNKHCFDRKKWRFLN